MSNNIEKELDYGAFETEMAIKYAEMQNQLAAMQIERRPVPTRVISFAMAVIRVLTRHGGVRGRVRGGETDFDRGWVAS